MEVEKRFVKVGQLKKGGYLLIDGTVCRIAGIEKSKPGKHGSAKARVTAMGVFQNVKKTLLKSTGDEAEVPIIVKGSAQVVAAMGDNVQVMDLASYETFDVPKPKDISGLASGTDVEYQRYGKEARITRKK